MNNKKKFDQEKELIFDFIKEGVNIAKGVLILIGIIAFIALIYVFFKNFSLYFLPKSDGVFTIILILGMFFLVRELNKVKKENERLRDKLEEIKNDEYDEDY